FLDEPTAGVDVHSRALFWEVIQEEADAGVTVFVTTHFLEETDYCDWVSFIDAGRVIADAEPEALRRQYSDGYEVALDLPADARRTGAQALAAAGGAVSPGGGGLRVRVPALEPNFLAALEGIAAAQPQAQIHIAQPPMTDIFRRVLATAA